MTRKGETTPKDIQGRVRMTFSVIIVNYNYEKFIHRAVASVLDQTHKADEIIVVDDCSTDDSMSILASFGEKIKIIRHQTNRGQSAAINSGFEASMGDIVSVLDSDDYYFPDFIELMVRAVSKGAVQSQGRLLLVDDYGVGSDTFPQPEQKFDDGIVRHLLLHKGRYATTVTSGLAFRREILEKVMPIPEHDFVSGGDGYLTSVVPIFGEVASVDATVGAYRKHSSNHSSFSGKLSSRALWRLLHDENRLKYIAKFACDRGEKVESDALLNDHLHVEERILSLLLSPDTHPYSGDSRKFLTKKGIASTRSLAISRSRVMVYRLWWIAAGYFPTQISRKIVVWKMEAATRPLYMKKLAKIVRRAIR